MAPFKVLPGSTNDDIGIVDPGDDVLELEPDATRREALHPSLRVHAHPIALLHGIPVHLMVEDPRASVPRAPVRTGFRMLVSGDDCSIAALLRPVDHTPCGARPPGLTTLWPQVSVVRTQLFGVAPDHAARSLAPTSGVRGIRH